MSSCLKNFCSLARFSPCAFLMLAASNTYPQAGALDSSFNPPFTPEVNMDSRALAELPDGKILVGFTQYSFLPRSNEVYLARLNPDGTALSLQPPFPGIFTNTGRGVSVLSVMGDGKIMVGGMFRLGTNTSVSTLTRLNSDATWDTSFDHAQIDGRLWCLAVQSDGRILIGGEFSHVHGAPRTNIARLNTDGSLDASFLPAEIGGFSRLSGGQVRGIVFQSDNKILIAGEFGSVGGIARWNIARLNVDGSHDQSFDPAAMFGHDGLRQNAQWLTLDDSGRILICGQFGRFDNEPRVHIARLHTNGALDTSFSAPIDGESVVVHRAIVQSDGKIVIAGGFATTGAIVRADVARLNSDGSVDATFDAGNIEGSVSRLIRQQDGKYVLGGQVASINGVARNFAARLLGDSAGAGGKIQFSAASFRASEDWRVPAQLVVSRSDGRTGAVSVDFSTRALSATTNDFKMTNGTVYFADGEFAPKAIDLEVIDDAWKERTEEFTVVLENPQGGAVLGQPNSARVRINENDYAGSVDTSFAPGAALRGPAHYSFVDALLLQPDGRLVVGGSFTPEGANRNHLTRLNGGGSVDSTFAAGMGPNGDVTALAAQPDGRILVAGDFTIFNALNANGLVRLEPSGVVDQSFSVGGGVDGPILAIAAEPGGNVLIGGEFESVNGVNRKGLARLNSSGVLQPLDVQLTGDGYAYVEAITLLTNGGAYIGGLFERAGGLPRNGLFRLLPNGSVDPDFRAATVTNQFDVDGDYTFYVYCVVPLPDGKILVGGDFYEVDGEMRHGIVRLNGDGSLDRSFVPDFDDDSYIISIARLPNGQLYAGGSFDLPTLPFWVDGVVRLDANGRIDWSFEPAFIDGLFETMLLQSNGQVILGGYFDECAEMPRHNLARLNVETVPLLAIEKVGDTSVCVSWPGTLGDLSLEAANALQGGLWSPATGAVLSNGRYNYTNAVDGPQWFYRVGNR